MALGLRVEKCAKGRQLSPLACICMLCILLFYICHDLLLAMKWALTGVTGNEGERFVV